MSLLCSVCGQSVLVNKHLFIEHKNKKGAVCYGSFTPTTPPDPFKVQNVKTWGINQMGIGNLGSSSWHPSPIGEPIIQEGYPDP